MNTAGIGQTITIGVHNAVVDGVLLKGIETTITFIPQESDLDLITDVEPGDLAATYGMSSLWHWNGTEWLEV